MYNASADRTWGSDTRWNHVQDFNRFIFQELIVCREIINLGPKSHQTTIPTHHQCSNSFFKYSTHVHVIYITSCDLST